MKSTQEFSGSDLKLLIVEWMAAHGITVEITDDWSIDPSGDVTITKVIPIVGPVSPPFVTPVVPTPPPLVPPVIPAVSPGHTVVLNPPYSVTGSATMFGLDWDGADDQGDENKDGQPLTGFFTDPSTGKSYITHVKTQPGVSLPREVLLSTFLHIDDWATDGIDHSWSMHETILRQWVLGNQPLVTIDSEGASVLNHPIVDAGPTAGSGNALDLTYLTAHALNTNGKAVCTYMVSVADNPLEIRGWDFLKKRVSISP